MPNEGQLRDQIEKVEQELNKLRNLLQTHAHSGVDGTSRIHKVFLNNSALTLASLITNSANGVQIFSTGQKSADAAYCRLTVDLGGGKYKLYANFPTGAAILLATEP